MSSAIALQPRKDRTRTIVALLDFSLQSLAHSRTNPPMRRLFLKDSVSGDIVEDVFVITGKQFSATTNGKFFIKAFISDRSSQITARMWNATRDIFNTMPESGFL